ncbi:MAG: VPLPA-CTERM sorting domain-containing protein [Rhodobacteraceae bacterium]|nr:VPLPA-CTERM sorting domain-containing protein [Paracoccaceae bacterium]
MMTFFKSAMAAVVLAMAPMAASAVTIDFDALDASSAQTVPLFTFTEDGFTFELSFTRTSGVAISGPAIFDSANPVNGDTDLSPITQGNDGISGNILILQEAGSNIPDDAAGAGTITLTLVRGSNFRFLGASAIDNTDFKFSSIIGGTKTALGTIDIGDIEGNRPNGTGALTFATPSGVIGVNDSILIEFGGSGGVDSLKIAPVPVPAALPLLLAGLGGLGLMKRRKNKTAKA